MESGQIRETLDRILASQAFRKSEQCQRFLRYVVEHSDSGREELLKERLIGVEVFGRHANYDTAEDPAVRVRATEVRKRLAQYYAESPDERDVRLEIPSGSYRVEFHWPAAAQPGKRRMRARWLVPAGVALTAASLALIAIRAPGHSATLDRFWAPALQSAKPVMLYCGQPIVYFLSREVREKYREKLPPEKQRGSYAVTLDPEATIRGRDVIPVIDQFVGIGNAHTAALIAALLAGLNKPVEIRYADDVSFSDLRSSPSVLIGAFSNLWTLEMQGGVRFVFEQENGVRAIRDRSDNRTWVLSLLAPDGKTPEDYAIVSRLFDSGTGQVLILAAGITQYGTRAAGEFLTSGLLLNEVLAKGPADWPRKNLQVLLHTTVYRGMPGTPVLVKLHVW
jgi:hypothetical protein